MCAVCEQRYNKKRNTSSSFYNEMHNEKRFYVKKQFD